MLEMIANKGIIPVKKQTTGKFEMMKGSQPVVEPYSEPNSVYLGGLMKMKGIKEKVEERTPMLVFRTNDDLV